MPDQPQKENDAWQKIWDSRIAALTPILGKPSEMVFHATVPFHLGGFADVLLFPDYIPGTTYVTADLTGEDAGEKQSSLGNYELMVCARQEMPKAADLVSRLARYTCDAKIEPGQTMDVDAFFSDSTIRALLFANPRDEPVHFEFSGKRHGLLLCIGITAEELKFGRSQGTEKLLAMLKQHGVFPYTIPNRTSVVNQSGSILRNLRRFFS